jgi:hypothetical protein
MNENAIRQGFIKHAAMAQLHRWYIGYEEPRYGIANQLDILDADIRVKSGLGEAHGHEAYAARIRQLPTTWRNAHVVRSAQIDIAADGAIALTADITYLNKGLLPDGAVRTADLTYTTKLERQSGSVLPKFTDISIAQNSEGAVPEFTSAYAENRMLSLVHYWLALIEDPARDPEPVREILADGFALNFSSGRITDFDGFKAWLAGPGSAVAASTHAMSNFSCADRGGGALTLAVDFDWEGLLPDGTLMDAKSRHSWSVTDNPGERFARIRTMDVTLLKPFAPKN